MSSNPACVTIKTPLLRKATGNHLTKDTSQEKVLRALSLVSAKLKIEYAMQLHLTSIVLVRACKKMHHKKPRNYNSQKILHESLRIMLFLSEIVFKVI